MTVEEAIRARVSVKDYVTGPVPQETIAALLELAILAPNHRMTQPLAFRVMGPESRRAYAEALAARKTRKIEEPDIAERVREKVVRQTTHVPSMIGVLVHRDPDPEIREEDYATAFMAIQNLSLAAVERGLGTHVKTGAVMDEPSLRETLEVPDDWRLAAIVFVGEPAELPEPKPRDAAAERTRWLA